MIYFYYYKTASMEPSSSETTETKKEKTSSTSTSPDLDKMDVEPPDRKRDSPETRTVVIAPEKKRQKIALVRRDLNFLEDFYMDHTKNMLIILDYPNSWKIGCNFMTQEINEHYLSSSTSTTRLITMHWHV